MNPAPNPPGSSVGDRPFAQVMGGAALLAVAVRLPQILNAHFALDGDEAVLGLMARRFLAGRGLPLFFYGQRYGFSFVETGAASLGFLLFGESVRVLKLAALVLWLLGLLMHGLAARRLCDWSGAVVSPLMLSVCPAWLAWSMKARGGYVTAFVLSGLLLLLLARRSEPLRGRLLLAAGGCFALIAEAQAFFALALIAPLVVLLGRKRRSVLIRKRLGEILLFGAGALGIFVLLTFLGSPERSAGSPPVWAPTLFQRPDPWRALLLLGQRLAVALSGIYYYRVPGDASPALRAQGWIWLALLAVGLVRVFARGTPAPAKGVAGGILTVLAASLFVDPDQFAYRYLLPASMLLPLLIGLTIGRMRESGRDKPTAGVAAAIAAVLLLAVVLAPGFGRYSFAVPPGQDVPSERLATEGLVNRLTAASVLHVYTLDPMFQWNLIFASRENILARWLIPEDRVPEYGREVDRALLAGEPVALVAGAGHANVLSAALREAGQASLRSEVVAGRYFVVFDPPASLLEQFGFRIKR